MKESAGTYALPTLCLTGPASQFLSRCNIRCRHGHLPPLAGFTGYGKDVCVLGVVVTSEHSADVIPPSSMRDSLWTRVARRLTAASHVRLYVLL